MSGYKVWALKTVKDEDRALQTVDSYNDQISDFYNYDSNVANSKQIAPGDFAILIDKVKILGVAKIESIDVVDHIKIVRRCKECESTTIDKRKKLTPPYRCNKGHVFDEPREFDKLVSKYSASFKGTFRKVNFENNNLSQLRSYYLNGYNQNMSMQLLDRAALRFFPEVKHSDESFVPTDYSNGFLNEAIDEQFIIDHIDDRETIIRILKARKGQSEFKNKLVERYGAQCMVTGCEISNVLHAAHIYPYRGPKYNNPVNGLLLRADIHILYDADLVAIDPETFIVHFHTSLINEYKAHHQKHLLISDKKPARNILRWRWSKFLGKQIGAAS